MRQILIGVHRGAFSAELLTEAHAAGMHVRCGFGGGAHVGGKLRAVRELADVGADEISSGRPDWIARFIRRYTAGG